MAGAGSGRRPAEEVLQDRSYIYFQHRD